MSYHPSRMIDVLVIHAVLYLRGSAVIYSIDYNPDTAQLSHQAWAAGYMSKIIELAVEV